MKRAIMDQGWSWGVVQSLCATCSDLANNEDNEISVHYSAFYDNLHMNMKETSKEESSGWKKRELKRLLSVKRPWKIYLRKRGFLSLSFACWLSVSDIIIMPLWCNFGPLDTSCQMIPLFAFPRSLPFSIVPTQLHYLQQTSWRFLPGCCCSSLHNHYIWPFTFQILLSSFHVLGLSFALSLKFHDLLLLTEVSFLRVPVGLCIVSVSVVSHIYIKWSGEWVPPLSSSPVRWDSNVSPPLSFSLLSYQSFLAASLSFSPSSMLYSLQLPCSPFSFLFSFLSLYSSSSPSPFGLFVDPLLLRLFLLIPSSL